jgi:hypothetical protein
MTIRLRSELDRLADAGGLPTSARPGTEFVIWAAMHGLAVLVADDLVRLDSPQAIDREAERVLGAVLTGLAAEPPPFPPWPTPRSAHSEALARHQAEPDPASKRYTRSRAEAGCVAPRNLLRPCTAAP